MDERIRFIYPYKMFRSSEYSLKILFEKKGSIDIWTFKDLNELFYIPGFLKHYQNARSHLDLPLDTEGAIRLHKKLKVLFYNIESSLNDETRLLLECYEE